MINTRTDKSIRIWRVLQLGLSSPIVIENAHPREVADVLWNTTTDTSFASVGRDCWVKLWKCTGHLEREIKVAKPHGAVVLELVEFSPDGEMMCVVDNDGTIILYDVGDNYTKLAHLKMCDHVNDIKWPNKGHEYLLAALDNGTVEVLRPNVKEKSLHSVHTLRGHKSPVTCLSVDPRGRYMAFGTGEGIVSLWKTSNMLNYQVLAKVDQEIAGVEISRDGAYIAVAFAQDSNVRIYDSDTLEEVYEVPNSDAGKQGVLCMKWLPYRGSFAYISEKGKVMEVARKETKSLSK